MAYYEKLEKNNNFHHPNCRSISNFQTNVSLKTVKLPTNTHTHIQNINKNFV